MDRRTPLARARGLGSAHHGSSHWWRQRVTALVLLCLGLWFVMCLAAVPDADPSAVRQWFRSPINSAMMLVFTAAAFYHGSLGLQVVLEDYVHARWLKLVTILACDAVLMLAWLGGSLALLKLGLGA